MKIQDKTREELILQLNELLQENDSLTVQKESLADELVVVNKELAFQNEEKENRAAELADISEVLRQGKSAIIKSNEAFLQLFEHNPTSMGFRRISDSRMINVNASYLEMFGFVDKGEVIGKTSAELKLIPDHERYRVNRMIDETGDTIKDFEVQMQKKNGESFWIAASLLKLEINNEPCLLTVGIDITERKKAEKDLLTKNATIIYQNDEKKKRAAELVIANIELVFQNEEKENRAAELIIAHKELLFQNEEKEKRASELTVFNSVLREVELSLVKSNETFLKLFNHNPAAMGIRRISDSVMVNVNDAFLELYGYASNEEVIGKTSFELKIVPDQEKLRVASILDNTNEVIRDFEVQLNNKNGDSLWVSASLLKLEIDNEPCILTVGIDITERKKGEYAMKKVNEALTVSNEALKESEASLTKSNDTFFKLFDNNPCGISICTKEGRKYLNVNDAFLKLYGFSTKEEVIGKTGVTLGLVAEIDSNTVDEIILNSKFSKDFEVRIQAKNGKKLCISASMLNINIDGTPCVIVVSIDVTERKKAEEELKKANVVLLFENEEKENRAAELIIANKELAFQSKEKEKRAEELLVANKELIFQNGEKEKRAAELLIANKELDFQSQEKVMRAAELILAKEKAELYLDMAGSAFLSLDPNGNVLFVNQKCSQLLEYDTSEELEGKNWFDTCIPYEMNEGIKYAYSEVMKGQMEAEEYYENEIVTKSGRRRLVYWNNSLIKDKDGKLKEILCSGIDITDRKLSEEALIKSKDEFHLLAESMPQIVWITLADGMNI